MAVVSCCLLLRLRLGKANGHLAHNAPLCRLMLQRRHALRESIMDPAASIRFLAVTASNCGAVTLRNL